MAKTYYEPGEHRAERVEDLFETIAPQYDRINDLQSFWMHRSWKRRLVRMSAVKAGDRALDVCCGTGDIATALARSGAQTTGLDFSKAMLKVAADRNLKSQISNLKFLTADAQNLPFGDNSFDVVTIGYGLRNLSSWQRGLEEMHRVAKPGGCLLILEFGKPNNAFWRQLYFGYLKFFVPIFGKLFCGDAATHAYIYESLLAYPAQNGVAAHMRELGCKDVSIVNLIGGAMSINYARK
ncbi:MAG TPA: bifunctional demethylmenaquinone methyltransferase/2-methoxy-6-polyprenyl-1,4-benzoquinol methylase UbiE [Verrucomicrobiae bacterium]|jgi:demethylmenaquinone methyltransferase/2-methoxy-6-polyprenyl-1,4-benzoquinol methylase|nr:bifunctional demethylmenaquinone methyltransferase/2-methoxy-6-polyprenyl-1,4-benzoquinol methylase UbiE [Verrucomicrobiae bacterium]